MDQGLIGCSEISKRFSTVIDTLMVAVRDVLQPEFADAQLVTDGDTLSLVAHRGLENYFLHSFRRLARNSGTACTRAFDGGVPVTIRDVYNDPTYAPYTDIAKAIGYNAVTSIPLLTTGGKCVGVVSALFAHRGEPTAEQITAMVPFSLCVANEVERLLDGTSATLEADALFQRLLEEGATPRPATIVSSQPSSARI